MIELNIRNSYYRQNKNMRILKTLNYSRIFQNITISNLQKRFHSIVHTVLLGIIGFVIMICWLLKQLLLLVSYLFVGLSVLLMSILIICLKPLEKILLLQVIQTRYMFALIDLSVWCLLRNKKLKRLSDSWATWPERKLNLSLRKVINLCTSM